MFLVLLDVTVVNVAVPSIASRLQTSTAGIEWVVDGYAVALASLLLAGGALGDRFAHRSVLAAGLIVFGAASAGCALAPATGFLIAARAAQGVGAALLLPGSIAAIADAHPDRASQARALGMWAGVSSLALPAGPLLGGLLVSTLGWRAVFWINPPVAAICLAGVLRWVRPSLKRSAQRLDLSGLALGTLSLAAIVYAVIAATTSMTAAIVASAVAVGCIVAFVYVERRVAKPLLPPAVFAVRAFKSANASALVMNLTSNGLLFLLTRYLQSVLGKSALDAGAMLLPLFVPAAAAAPLAGRLTARYGPRPVMLGASIIAAAGQLCLLAITVTSAYLSLLPALICVGLGVGMFTAPVVAAAIQAVPPERSGLASGVNNTARQVGTALGVAIYGALAGAPTRSDHFVGAMRGLGLAAAIAWLLVAGMSAIGMRAGAGAGRCSSCGRWR